LLKIVPGLVRGDGTAVWPFSDLIVAIGASVIAVAALLVVGGRLTRDRGVRGDFVAYFGAGALAAMICAAMNIVEGVGGGAVAAAVGNATNVIAPAALWAGARRVNGRSAIGALTAAACGLLVLAVTFVVPLDAATLIKTAAIAVFCALAAVELRRAPMRTLAGSATIAVALGAFAVYNAWRLIVAATAGPFTTLWNTTASAGITSVASAVTIIAVSVGALRLGRRLLDDPAPGTRTHARQVFRDATAALLAVHPSVTVLRLRLPDLDLIRAAHGSEHAERMLAALADAARAAVPDAVAGVLSRDAIAVTAAAMPEDAAARVRQGFAQALSALGGSAPETQASRSVLTSVADLETLFASARRSA
jgi:hypothetical protein